MTLQPGLPSARLGLSLPRRAIIPFSPSPFPQPSQIPLPGTPKRCEPVTSTAPAGLARPHQTLLSLEPPAPKSLLIQANLHPQLLHLPRSTLLSCCPGAPLEPLPDIPRAGRAVPSCEAALLSKDRKQTSPKQSLGRRQRCCLSCSSPGTAVNHGERTALPARARQRAWAELCAANGGSKGSQERLLGSLCLWGGPAELVLSPALPPAARIREVV